MPQPFGGRYRQIMVYVDPLKLEAHQLSVMDIVRAVNDSNLILPAGDIRIGTRDYNLYSNSQVPDMEALNRVPHKTVDHAAVMVGDVGKAVDGSWIQYNVVRVDGQDSVYLPIMKQGGDANFPSPSSTASRTPLRISWIFPNNWSPASFFTHRFF